MTNLSPLSMSQTKEELLKHLNLDPETYTLMAKETDRVYKWLTSNPAHLKKNCKRRPPYDWSDIVEKAKDEALQRIAESGGEYTGYYWNLATPTPDCPNWIAKWFLYHKFRYRDGRNRNTVREFEDQPLHYSHNRSAQSTGRWDYTYNTYNATGSMACPEGSISSATYIQNQYQAGKNCGENFIGYNTDPSDTTSWGNSYHQDNMNTNVTANSGQRGLPKIYYDPIRDM